MQSLKAYIWLTKTTDECESFMNVNILTFNEPLLLKFIQLYIVPLDAQCDVVRM